MIRGRLTHIGDREARPSDYQNPRAERLAAREFNLSFADAPQTDNRVVAGRWWEPGTRSPSSRWSRGWRRPWGSGSGTG